MPPPRSSGRPSWEDRFVRPTYEALRAEVADATHGELVDLLRARLLATPDLTESLTWHGIPWRWTLVYRVRGEPEGPAVAYLVLRPEGPQIAIPFPHDLLQQVRLRKLSRVVRDGIAQAKVVAGIYWPQWELAARSHLDDFLSLVEHRMTTAQSA